MTRDDLAKACANRGLELSASALANIETGRRDAEGRRRREVTIDELVVLADALNVPPVLLVFPVGQEAVTPWAGELGSVDTWLAAKWFGGQGEHPIISVGSEVRRVNRRPIRMFADFEQASRRVWLAQARLGALQSRVRRGELEAADLVAWTEQTIAEAEESLADITQRMRDHGLEPPERRESRWVESAEEQPSAGGE